MRILTFIPSLNIEVNDIAQALAWIADQGNEVVCLTSRTNPSKSIGWSEYHSKHHGLEIIRPWPTFDFAIGFPEIAAVQAAIATTDRDFDVILCCQEMNLPLADRFNSATRRRLPLVTLVERAGNLARSGAMNARSRAALSLRHLPTGSAYYQWLANRSDTVVTCDPADLPQLDLLRQWNEDTHYIPWCTDPGIRPGGSARIRGQGIFAGALASNKNPSELRAIISELVKASGTSRFVLVTAPRDRRVLSRLKQELGHRIEIRFRLTLAEAAMAIGTAQYGISAAEVGGWGFIGNCWAMRTPIILAHPNGFVTNPDSVFRSWEYDDMIDAVTSLLADEEGQRRICDTASAVFNADHTARAVGSRLLATLTSTG